MLMFSVVEWFFDAPHRLMGVAMFCAAAWLLGMNVWTQMRVGRARNWPIATAKILRSDVVTESATSHRVGAGGAGATVFMAKVEYEFEVNGLRYASNVIAPGGVVGTSNPDTAQGWTDRFPVGAQVPVSYNPLRPTDCCLVCEHVGEWLNTLVAAIFGIIGFVILVK